MPLHTLVKAFLAKNHLGHTDPLGVITRQNAVAGKVLGLHNAAEANQIIRAANADFEKLPASDQSLANVQRCIDDQRFDRSRPNGVRDDYIRRSYLGTPDLRGVRLAHVMFVGQLDFLMSQADKERLKLRNGVHLPVGRSALTRPMADKILQLSEDDREFTLAPQTAGGEPVFLGSPLIWFTLEQEVQRIRKSLRPGENLADWVRDALGLVERKAGSWQVLLEFDGDVVQKQGHYRPTFCDPQGYRRFMLRGSDPVGAGTHAPWGPPGPWGQAADLQAIADGAPICDGGLERVAHRVSQGDFGSKTLRFELLGQLETTRGEVGNETDELFAERLRKLNL